jgi:hypothetical protein
MGCSRTVARASATLVLVCMGGLPCASAADGIDFAAIRAKKVIQAIRIDEPIVVDGRLDEPAWARAPVATDFYQQEPKEGELSTERTEIRFLYDQDYLYIGGTLYDSDPRGGITNELKRDFSTRDGDAIALILDTFNDYDSYNFIVNPGGAERDSQNYDDGRQANPSWDAVWWGKTARFPGGWTVEMKIPFKSLRFPKTDAVQSWGMNIFRLMRRKNELTFWSPQPRQFFNFMASYAGQLTGIQGVKPGRNLYIKPFATGTASNLNLPSVGRKQDGDGGLDVKWGLTSAATMDLTLRTDFSQVEVDEQQINLTRFSLFFPEKRDFFLENQGAFRVGDQDSSGQTAGVAPGQASATTRRDLLPFFSRRIGLSASGQAIPILGGARLTGRQGDWTFGVIDMETREFSGRPGDNFTAFRGARNFGASSVGGFYFGREAQGAVDHNRVAGGDVHLNFGQGKDFNAFVMTSDSTGVSGAAGRVAYSQSTNKYSLLGSYTNISPTFRNDLGFLPRGDIGLTAWNAARYFRPENRWFRSVSFGTQGEIFDTSAHEGVMSRHVRGYSVQAFPDGGAVETDVDWNYERLTAPFEVSKGIVIPVGEYRFRQILPTFTSNKSNSLSGSIGYTGGEFYSGTIQGWSTSVRLRVDEHLATSVAYSRNDVSLPQGRFTTDLPRFRVDYSFSTKMFLNAFVQYNSAAKTWLTNVRYQIRYRPLSDFFLVYNDTRVAGAIPQRTVALKHTLLLSF